MVSRAFLLFTYFVLGAASVVRAQPIDLDSADSVLREVQRRQDLITSESSVVRMEIYGRRGKKRTRDMAISTRTTDGESESLISFTGPPDIRGMGLLTIERDGSDDQRLYLPALGRVQRIAGETRGDRFAGSDFSFEDLSSRDPEDYFSELASVSDSLVVIDSRPERVTSSYGRIVFSVDARTFVILNAEYYDTRNRLWKRLETKDIVSVGPETWRANQLVMTDLLEDRRTELTYVSRDTQSQIPDATFTERWLRRGLQ